MAATNVRTTRALTPAQVAACRAVPAPGPVPAIGAGVDTGGGHCGHAVSVSSAARQRGNAGEEAGGCRQPSGTGSVCAAASWASRSGRAVRGAGGAPPYLVRFDDGHTSLVFPGPDAVIEHPRTKRKKRPAKG
jgi:Domain of unknown function (DUF1918)